MDLKCIVLIIIKILISVPGAFLVTNERNGAALMGGHLDNMSSGSENLTAIYNADFNTYDDPEQFEDNKNSTNLESPERHEESDKSEEIPDPEKLVVSGYNLPENIFNRGKPFYLEKDPLTGNIDFNSKSQFEMDDSEYEYVEDEPRPDIFDKANIDRKDGSLHAHKPSDVNQLTPNFHDFLNLPVKYNPEKYVYPLISSSYANTKIQGNVAKQHNHKDYSATTFKPTVSPTYYTTKHYVNKYKTTKKEYTTPYPITTTSTTKKYSVPSTTAKQNLMNAPINESSYDLEFDEQNSVKTKKPHIKPHYEISTKLVPTASTVRSTTKKVMSFFEQLFGDYDDVEPTELPETPSLSPVLSTKYIEATTPQSTTSNINDHGNFSPDGQPDSNYDYEDYNNEYPITDNIAVESKPVKNEVFAEVKDKFYDETSTSTKKSVVTATSNDHIISVENKFQLATDKPSTENTFVVIPEKTNKRQQEPTGKKDVQKKSDPVKSASTETILDDSYFAKPNKSITFETTTKGSTTMKVTSLPLGENHITNTNKQPIIVATTNLKEQLNNEKVSFTSFGKGSLPPSTSNVHIAPDQDVVSFVVGNQQSVDGGQYVGVSFKESPYDHNPFRPLYSDKEPPSQKPTLEPPKPDLSANVVKIQPSRNTEASLTIGKPINGIKAQIPGQVVDDVINSDKDYKEYTIGSKIVFPDSKPATTFKPEFAKPILQHNKPPKPIYPPMQMPNREVLKLNSKPMFHQLPSDLTPPNQKVVVSLPNHVDRIRPPWDPRPGHFYSGRPEYARPPRPPVPHPPSGDVYKRLDNLPNILPQFRPNARVSSNVGPYYYENVKKPPFVRQPLLERPSNRPLELMSNLQPPPLPKNVYQNNIRPPFEYEPKHHLTQQKLPILSEVNPTEKYNSVDSDITIKPIEDQFDLYQSPPKVTMPNRRQGEESSDVETLQMIQAKQADEEIEEKSKRVKGEEPDVKSNDETVKKHVEKPLYVVYPVNTPPLKLDVIDDNKKEAVVIGTRAELPLPPSEINQFSYDQTPILSAKDRNDAPILKPHPKPATFPIRTDFPYHIERPDPSILNAAVPEVPSNNNYIDMNVNANEKPTNAIKDPIFASNNQWNVVEDAQSRIINSGKISAQTQNQIISATLKTFTEKPIAVAYTPTEPHYKEYGDKFSMPNYGGSVIPEIRPNSAEEGSNSEFTVSAIMHTHPHIDLATQNMEFINKHKQTDNHRSDNDLYTTYVPPQDFQAPFQASVNLDQQSMSQGWTVIREKTNKTETSTAEPEVTTIPIATTSEFDIENFKPQLIGGFKPIYSYPEDQAKKDVEGEVNEREE